MKKYYQSSPNQAYYIEEADIPVLLPIQELTEITEAKYNSIVSPPLTWAQYQQQAQALLNFDDTVAIRCIKAGVPYPAAWLARDVALRAIVAAPSGDPTQPLPPQPATYPAGT